MNRKISVFLIVIAMLLGAPRWSRADFVVNTSIISNEFTRDDLVQIFLFLRKYEFRQGVKLTVVLPPPTSYLFKSLASNELGMSSSQYYASIVAKMSDGSATPIFASSESEVLIKVASTPYSIGYFYNYVKINDGYGVKSIVIKK